MPLPNQYAQANIVMHAPTGEEYEIVTWWIGPTAPATIDQTYVDALADAMDSKIQADLKACLTVNCGYVGIKLRVSDSGVTYTSVSVVSAGAGTVAGDNQPAQVAAVIQKHSQAPGRPGLGRWFVPLVPEGFTTGAILNAGGVTAYSDLGLNLRQLLIKGADTWPAGHRSRKNDTLLTIASVRVNHRLKRQGRRLVRDLLD